jgi:predicted ATPase
LIVSTRGTSQEDGSPATTHNLPPQLTPFIGRVEEIAEIGRLLVDPACRLLTLVGPGGSGKTRLAIEAAARQPDDAFLDGVYFVSLQPHSSPSDIIPVTANALRFCFVGESESRQQLLDHLREKRLLLVLDNFEHLLSGADLVLDILETASGVKILVTSRETLSLRGEWTYHVKGMCTPRDEQAEVLEDYDAVQLFVECARRAQGSFSLADEQADIIRLCQLVEGMPLAIELAAPWVKTLTCASIADEIQRDIDFLATNLRDMPERHRSMRAAFDHSWRLLTEGERAVFQKLSVFRGGFEREAAERAASAALPTLVALVDKCFLYKEATGRYQMHELLRQYGEERLKEAGETDAARSAHCAYYADFMQQREADIKGRRQQGALDEIETDLENVRAAWHWALEQRDYDAIDRSLESLHWCLNNMRSRLQEGEELFRRARERLAPQPGDPPHPVWGRVTVRHEEVFRYRRTGAGAVIENCFAIAQRHGDRAEIAFCLKALGQYSINCGGDFNEALSYYEEGLAHYRDLGDDFYTAEMLQGIGVCYGGARQFDDAVEFYRQSTELARRIGNEIGMVWALMLMGWIAMSTGNYAEGERRLREANIIQRKTGHKYGYVSTTPSLGWLAFYKGNFKEAKALAEEAFGISIEGRTGVTFKRNQNVTRA